MKDKASCLLETHVANLAISPVHFLVCVFAFFRDSVSLCIVGRHGTGLIPPSSAFPVSSVRITVMNHQTGMFLLTFH